jgi:uncharacterized protein
LSSQTSVLVCFSGGVDSSYLLAEAVRALGPERAHAFTAVSASLDPSERAHASQIAASLGAPHALVDTHELDDARYTTNPKNRCYFCKTEVYGAARRFATERGFAVVVDGFNLDDRGDHRPGRKAAKELGVRSPLDDHAFTKADIRAAAHALGLPVWDKPALACLSSRFPYGTEITAARLAQVAAAERALRALDFRVVRVRWFGEEASLEVGQDELPRARDLFDEIESALRATGFHTVHLDPNGYRQGRLNLLP